MYMYITLYMEVHSPIGTDVNVYYPVYGGT